MTTHTANPELHSDGLVRNSRSIASNWIYVAGKLVVAGLLLNMIEAPHLPLILAGLLLQDLAIHHTRERVAKGDASCRVPYLALVFTTVCAWTAIAVALWQQDTIAARSLATGLLLTIPMIGALRGFRSRSFLAITTSIPVLALCGLIVADVATEEAVGTVLEVAVPTIIGCLVLLRMILGLHAADRRVHLAELERERLLQQIHASRTRLEQVATLGRVAGWNVDLQQSRCTLDPMAQRMLGCMKDSLSFHEFAELFTLEGNANLMEALVAMARDASRIDVEVELRHAGAGTARWVRLIAEVPPASGTAVAFSGALQDITTQVHLTEQRRLREVAQAVTSLSAKTAAAFKADLADASHLVASLPYSRLDGAQQRQIDTLQRSLDRAFDTALSLQAFAAGSTIKPRAVDLNASVAAITDTFRMVLPSGITMEFKPSPDMCDVVVDEAELELALLHVCFNSRDAMPTGGTMVLSTHVDNDGSRVVEVRDTGEGMTPELKARVLDPFFTTKHADGARGLGLSMVHGMVVQAGGKLSIDSTPGSGTTVRLCFPSPQVADRLNRRQQGDPVLAKVLLVLDDEAAFQRLSPVLHDAGLMLHLAKSPREALSLIEGQLRYQIILLEAGLSATLPGQVLQSRLPRLSPHARLFVMHKEEQVPTDAIGDHVLPGVSLAAPLDQLVDAIKAALPGTGPVQGSS